MGNRLTKIYTRTGDDGSTGLGDGTRVPKEHARVEAYGTVDELNSALGVVLAADPPDELRSVLEHEGRMLGLPESYFERLVYDLIVGASLPAPTPQHEVRDGRGKLLARVDLAYPEAKIAIELLGKQFHYTPKGFERDPERRNRLEVRGWIVLEFTWRRYVDTPNRICHEVAEALHRRSGEM